MFTAVSKHLFHQMHVCNDSCQEYCSYALLIGREVANSISESILGSYDQRLILGYRNLELALKILNYSSNLSLLLSNKIALKKDGNTSVVHGKTEQQLIRQRIIHKWEI